MTVKQQLVRLLQERILVLDGGMGTMLQRYSLGEDDYRGDRFLSWEGQLKGNNDLLCITRPDVIAAIHYQYLDAGADIFTTNTFNANAISQADYNAQHLVKEINLAAGRLARSVADDYMSKHAGRTIFVAGSIGPTNKTASMSPDVNDPAYRAVSYTDLYLAYREQIAALIEGGVDILLFETIFDTLNVKAGLNAAADLLKELKLDMPIMLSVTLSAQGGRTFSGQTLDAFLASVQHAPIISVGLNCSFGAADMKPYLEELSHVAPYFITAYPNAGLPNSFGAYDETPELMLEHARPFVEEGLVNVLGGCCGTTPEHIARFPELVRNAKPHMPVSRPDCLRLSGLELLEVKPENNFVNIGERCNVAGSRKFLRLIKEKNYEEALAIARKQVADGAQIIDVNMDDGLLDAEKEMTVFLNLVASEPDIARVPVMIDSSNWNVIEQGLMCVQGKSVVNSISLKEGETVFLAHAERIKSLGAAVVVMAFDEKGQADTFERKTEVCARAYKLLTEQAGFNPNDIIFDPNVLAIATGIEEHNRYGLDFIRAVRWIKGHLPGAKISGGISNLSFAFRGNNYVREAMHAVFLYHAINAGLDMGIVNPSSSVVYEDIEPAFRELLEDVVLCRRDEAAEELIEYAQTLLSEQQHADKGSQKQDEWRNLPVDERIMFALVKGVGDYLEEDIREALEKYPRAVDIIDKPLMAGMNKVGELFGSGKMFLPQVVKSARTMKKAVSLLQPAIESEQSKAGTAKAGKIVFATVKGDVHDIGKNIVSIVLACNNYEVIDLGVMVPADKIVKTAIEERADLVCLSGLITPSLQEMVYVAEEMQKAGLTIPLLVGGATTSALHTAIKIAPHYAHPVVHVADASQNPLVAAKLLNPAQRDLFVRELVAEQERLRDTQGGESIKLVSLGYAREHAFGKQMRWTDYIPVEPACVGETKVIPYVPIKDVVPYINWTYFFNAWKLNGRFAEITRIHGCDACRAAWISGLPETDRPKAVEAMQLYKDACRLLDQLTGMDAEYCKAVYGIFPANSDGDDLLVGGIRFPMLRQQTVSSGQPFKSLADFVMPVSEQRRDFVGAFAVTAGAGADYLYRKFTAEGDTYKAVLLQTLTDRLAEALSEYLHERVRKSYWGYDANEKLTVEELFKTHYQGIRPAIGYPSVPDQKQVFLLDKLLNLSQIGVTLTENGAMLPTASVCGFYIAHPEASYFMVGEISEEQLSDYAVRRNLPVDEVRALLNRNL